MLKEFKGFLLKGNVLDLAIAVIMGAAFGKIVTTFTEGIIMPIVGMLAGGVDFTQKVINLTDKALPMKDGAVDFDAVKKSGMAVLQYGQLISDIINFVIVGLVMFMIAKWAMNFFAKAAADAPPPPPTPEETLLAEIRDLLARK